MAVNLWRAHYFLWFFALTGILQYVSMFAKEHSKQAATSVGTLMAILPFVALMAKPSFCGIADHFNSHKLVLIAALTAALFGYGLLSTVPYIDDSYNWYWLCSFVLIANSAMGVVTSLSDSLAMNDVIKKSVSYGSMRVFGTLGWGCGSFLAGVVNDERYISLPLPMYLPGLIFIFGILIIIDILLVAFKFNGSKRCATETNLEISLKTIENSIPEVEYKSTVKPRVSVIREIMTAFSTYPSLFQYALIAIVFGILTGFHWTFFYWALGDAVGYKDTLLPGLCGAVQTFVGELPFFLFSERIVNKLGIAMSLNIGLLAFAVRYIGYAYLITKSTAYYVLFLEITQGPAFGLFYCVITKVAQDYAMKAANNDNIGDKSDNRTYATMQGIMSGCFEGAGVGIGSLIGGILIDHWMLRGIWLTGAVLALVTVFLNFITEIIKSKHTSVDR